MDPNSPTFGKEFLIQLTNNLYRLTLLFPKKEPLRYKIRELADEILANLILVSLPQSNTSDTIALEIKNDLEVLDSFFEVAKNQNWVSPSDILEIQKEYKNLVFIKDLEDPAYSKNLRILPENLEGSAHSSKIKEDYNPPIALGPPLPEIASKKEKVKIERNPRQEKILEILKEKGKAQVGEFKEIFPEVTKRTLRRDFQNLLKQGFIERTGERNNTFYQSKSK